MAEMGSLYKVRDHLEHLEPRDAIGHDQVKPPVIGLGLRRHQESPALTRPVGNHSHQRARLDHVVIVLDAHPRGTHGDKGGLEHHGEIEGGAPKELDTAGSAGHQGVESNANHVIKVARQLAIDGDLANVDGARIVAR